MKQFINYLANLPAIKAMGQIVSGNLINYTTGFIYGVFAARILGASGLGILTMIIALVQIINVPFKFEIEQVAVKLIREESDARIEEHSTLFYSQALSALLFCFVFLIALLLGPYLLDFFAYHRTALFLFAISEVMFTLRRTTKGYLMAKRNFKQYSIYHALSASMRDFVPILFMPLGIMPVCAGYLIAECLMCIYTLIRHVKNYTIKIKLDDVKTFIRNYFSHHTSIIINRGYSKLLPLLLGNYASSNAVGYYAVGKKIMPVFNFVLEPLKKYIYPNLIDRYKTDREKFFSSLRNFHYAAFGLFTIVVIATFLLVPFVIPVIYGNDFKPAIIIILILTPALAVNGILGLFADIAYAIDKQYLILAMSSIKIFLLPVILVGTAYYSYIGLAWAMASTYYCITLYKLVFLWKKFGFKWLIPFSKN